MSRTTRSAAALACSALALALPAAAGAAAPGWAAGDRVPHELPGRGATAASAGTDWLVGARAGSASARVAAAHGGRPLRLGGAFSVPAGRARELAGALARRGLLRWSQHDVRLGRASAFEGDGQETGWARGSVVPQGLVPPPAGAPIGIVDDLVDTAVPDVSQAKQLNAASATVIGPHGTEVASVAAGLQNGSGVIGILPGAPILSEGLKDSSCQEVGDDILKLVDAGAKIINLSLGTTDDCFYLQISVADAFASDALVVASSGNEFDRGNPLVYPAAYPHVLSVAALDQNLQPAYFSSANAAVDIAAPGERIPVALPLSFDILDGTQDGVTRADGTSFSAPIVSGVASWVRAVRPKLAAGQIADVLRHSAKDIGPTGWDSSSGFGLVDLAAALQRPDPPADPLEPNDGITFVNGYAFTKPDPYVWKGTRAFTLDASVDPVEDPVDVYRIRLPARAGATARLTPVSGNADLAVYDATAKSMTARPLGRSRRGSGHTDVVHVRNRTGRPRTMYVAVISPSVKTRFFDVQYHLRLSRG